LAGGEVTNSDPPNIIGGMTLIRIDTKGRLTYFEGVPARVIQPGESHGEFDWASILKEAGLDPATFQPVEPQRTPLQVFDEQRAFSGVYPAQPDIAIRVEAAAYQGKLTSFEVVEPWSPAPDQASLPPVGGSIVATVILICLFLGMLFGSAWLALRNIRVGRSDLKNAFRVALLLFVARIVAWAFTSHHVASIDEFPLFISGLSYALAWAVIGGVMYLAFEPYLRKIAPERVIAWNRLLAGDWRDPLVGRDVLIGAAGSGLRVFIMLLFSFFIPRWQGKPPSVVWDNPAYLSGINIFPAIFAEGISIALMQSFTYAFLILFLGLPLRRKWLGAIAVWLLFVVIGLVQIPPQGQLLLELAELILTNTVIIFIAVRFGVLATLSFVLVEFLSRIPFAADLTTWYAGNFILFILIIVALSFYGFYTSIAGQKLWQAKVFDES
jgi:serine/threonine-protein kinase